MTIADLLTRGVPNAVRAPLTLPRAASQRIGDVAVAAAIPIVLVVAWTVGDALQPAGYSPVSQTISVAAGHAGTDRWVPTAGLLAVGLGYLLIAFVARSGIGLVGRAGLVFTGACGLGVALCPEAADGPTPAHQFWSVVGAVALMTGPLMTLRRHAGARSPQGWRVAGCAFVAFAASTVWLVLELNGGHGSGLAERVTTTAEVCWPFVLLTGVQAISPRAGALPQCNAARDDA